MDPGLFVRRLDKGSHTVQESFRSILPLSLKSSASTPVGMILLLRRTTDRNSNPDISGRLRSEMIPLSKDFTNCQQRSVRQRKTGVAEKLNAAGAKGYRLRMTFEAGRAEMPNSAVMGSKSDSRQHYDCCSATAFSYREPLSSFEPRESTRLGHLLVPGMSYSGEDLHRPLTESATWRVLRHFAGIGNPQNYVPSFRSVSVKLRFVICCGLGDTHV